MQRGCRSLERSSELKACLLACGLALAGCQQPGVGPLAPPVSGGAGPILPPSLAADPNQPPALGPSADPALAAEQQRVNRLARQVEQANPTLGFRPAFVVVPGAEPALGRNAFGTPTLSVGLVRACESEGTLAGVLAWQVAEQYRQRFRQLSDAAAQVNREPPMAAREGLDNGSLGTSDRYRLAEIHKLGLDRRRPAPPPEPPPGEMIARQLLLQAGFTELDLQAAARLLQAITPAAR